MDVLEFTIAKADLHAVRQQLEIKRDDLIREKDPLNMDAIAEYQHMIKMVKNSIEVMVNMDRENNFWSKKNFNLRKEFRECETEINELNGKCENLIKSI